MLIWPILLQIQAKDFIFQVQAPQNVNFFDFNFV